ncbi:hypothetical protein [Arenicella xantha]|nr:hypothetical protein [Arenicella xantha]
MTSLKTANTFRKYHRLLGFFLAGIMAIYASSGVLMIFRTTDFLKYEQTSERHLESNLGGSQLGKILRLKDYKVLEDTDTQVVFSQGNYDKNSGVAMVSGKDYHPVLQKLVKMHKATVNSPLYFLNIFFGASLLFFAISSFFMFVPRLSTYRTGLKFAAAGMVLALIVVLF